MRLRERRRKGLVKAFITCLLIWVGGKEEEERQRLLATTRRFVVCEKLRERERGRGGMWREARRGNLGTRGKWEPMILWLL